ncbi:MAG: Aspartate aminotransferase [uncultured Thermomicrobiales bacterium]|uniref:Aminotransferase n=1 Tax=uncultured Thermomicrobiales bacterium TaxID=1645740 RepID=A0A6J4UN66_9BACT|nr:MAG: Aspartate aminotransferase [uncultured Thermomicrobiales bacterium]
MRPFSPVVEALPRSGIREVMEFAAGREGVIHLEVGEPSFATPDHIVDAALAAARAGHTRYTPNAGIPELRRAVAARTAARWGEPVAPEEVLVAVGAVNAIFATLVALVREGDEVLIPDPGWPNYASQVPLAGAVAVPYPLRPENGYLPDPADLDRVTGPRTRVVVLNNPSNPTGAVWPDETVAAVAAWARRRDLWVIADEIYEDLVFDGTMTPFAPFARERTVAVGGCSKSYAMTGWRIGWAVAPAALVALAAKTQEALVSCPSEVSQRAALAAVTGPQACVEEMRRAYARRRDLVVEALAPAGLLPTVPRGAFYALADLRATGMPSTEAAKALIDEELVATSPGAAFGDVAEGMVRLSLASADEALLTGCERIVRFAARRLGVADRE